jgi:hypothetical protein
MFFRRQRRTLRFGSYSCVIFHFIPGLKVARLIEFTVNLLKPTGYVMHQPVEYFNNCPLCPNCIYVFRVCLRTNSDLCHLQHNLIGFYNRDKKCLQRGTDWVFKWSGLRLCQSINWLVFITEMKSVYSAVRTGDLNKAVCVCATYSINWLVFITEMKSVYSAVRTQSLTLRLPY